MSSRIGTLNASETCSSCTTGTSGRRWTGSAPSASFFSSLRIAWRTDADLRSPSGTVRRSVSGARRSFPRSTSDIAEQRQQELRDEIVDDENQNARRHHRPRRALSHALGAAGRAETEVAGGDRDQAAEDERLRQPLN